MKLPIYNIEGKQTGSEIELSDSVFAIEPNDHVIYLAVKQYLANQRQGTHKAKNRNELAYSTRKIKKQKGTGGARAGSIKSPIFVGGGRVFGPVPRDYSFKLNKKMKDLARRSALSHKASSIIVVEGLDFAEPKTKQFVSFQKALNIEDKKSLIVLDSENKNVYLSARNLQRVLVLPVNQLNTYDIMNTSQIVLAKETVDYINNNL